ncbi:hypothetical protein V8E36_004333 [Tilletia maclaganii]
MDRFVPLSATTSTLGAHLAPDEEILTLQENVGLYHGTHKAKRQADGTLYLSSHRIIYVDKIAPMYHSCALSLALVRQTEYYAGFFNSSPKITLRLEPPPASILAQQQQQQPPRRKKPGVESRAGDSALGPGSGASSKGTPVTWICPVCGFSNSATDKCSLCGVSYQQSSSNRSKPTVPSSSGPSSSSHGAPTGLSGATQPQPPAPSASRPKASDPVPCPTCTFLNHPSMAACELCNAPLPGANSLRSLNRHTSSPSLPDLHPNSTASRNRTISTSAHASPRPTLDSDDDEDDDDDDDLGQRFPVSDPAIEQVKLSFRKGGDKAFYELLKTTLRQKAWQMSHVPPGARARDLPQASSSPLPARTLAPATISPMPSSSSVPSFATTIDIDGRRVPLSLLHRDSGTQRGADAASVVLGSSPARRGGAGIEAILRNTSLSHTQASTTMFSALADLDALQKKAKSMVTMAEKLNAQLSRLEAESRGAQGGRSGGGSGAGSVDQDSATLIRSSLVMLGLPSPAVTEDMVVERSQYELELARELADLLLSPQDTAASHLQRQRRTGLMGHGRLLGKGKERSVDEVRQLERAEEDLRLLSRSNAAALVELVEHKLAYAARGGSAMAEEDEEAELDRVLAESKGEQGARELIGLDEVWCVWNRARGVALLPPSDLRACAVHLPRLTEPPIRLRVFPAHSGSGKNQANHKSTTGLCVLHTPRYSESTFEARVLARLRFARRRSSSHPTFGRGLSAFEFAAKEGAPVVLIEQMLTGLEMGGNASIVRDEGAFRTAGGASGTVGAGSNAGGGGPNMRWFENEFERAWDSVHSYRTDAAAPL